MRQPQLTAAAAVLAAVTLAACAGHVLGTSVSPATFASATASPDRAAALASLVAAERGFSQLAADSGVWIAFRANMADSSILFRPGPVNGHQWTLDHPNPDRTALLRWEPRWVDVSRSGDFGFSTGPAEYREHGAADSVVHHSTFLSLWRRGADGRWRVFFDGGAGRGPWPLSADGHADVASPAPASATYGEGAATASLLAVDSTIGRAGRPGGAWDALLARLADDGHVYRQGRPLMMSRHSARVVLGAWTGTFSSVPLGSAMASSGDLAFTYGAYSAQAADAAEPQTGHYARFWRRAGDGSWRVAFDVTFPAPPRSPSS